MLYECMSLQATVPKQQRDAFDRARTRSMAAAAAAKHEKKVDKDFITSIEKKVRQ